MRKSQRETCRSREEEAADTEGEDFILLPGCQWRAGTGENQKRDYRAKPETNETEKRRGRAKRETAPVGI